ncbi:hypothetical protein RN001_011570 [Aquatica leii]|uniref:SEC14-like protein 2 n=1 Tax=Aquatica leii TaxID=1421715 RepID=A0AAN7QDY4_9COLE|nr:hypothetical protein RN001_011570 [Aquatica leii]
MAASKLTLDDNEKFALMKFRRIMSDVTKPHHDDYFLVRWLRARSWNVEAAEKMLRASLQWRLFWDVDDGLKTWEPPKALGLYYPSGSTGCDKNGSPVIFVPFSGLDIIGILHCSSKQDMIKLTIQILEQYLEIARTTSANNIVVIFDMDGFNLKHYAWRPAAEVVIALLQMYEANYPEILKACYIINAPAVFAVAFTVVKRFLNDYTLGKISIFKSDPRKWRKVLREHIPPEILPKYYGGDLVDADGNEKCTSMIRPGGKIPESYYVNNFGTTEISAEFTSTIVKKGRKLTLDFIVADAGCALKWDFRTEGHDIRFGITYCSPDGTESPAVRFQRVASHQVNEVGVIACQAPATYRVVFDNSYSILRSKKLHYNILVTEPLDKLDVSTLPESAPITNGSSKEIISTN